MTLTTSIILGIDPGSLITGYGLIETTGKTHRYLASGSIQLRGKEMAERLQCIYHELTAVIRQYQPIEIAIEQIFMHKNPNSALKLVLL
jgi:crossover junction endodeoxyribonuclease RuvC